VVGWGDRRAVSLSVQVGYKGASIYAPRASSCAQPRPKLIFFGENTGDEDAFPFNNI